MKIVWSPLALDDLESISDYIAKDNPTRAVTFLDELVVAVERLTSFPESGPVVEENAIFRQLIHKGCRLIYQFRVDQIRIITVLGPGRAYENR